jgi:hypothetical protein
METPKKTVLKEVYQRLRDDRMVESQADFGRKTKFTPTAVTQMIKGEKPLPFRMVKNLYKVFELNTNFIVSEGKDSAFYLKDIQSAGGLAWKETESELKKVIENLSRENQDLKQRLADKEKIIQLLEKQKP